MAYVPGRTHDIIISYAHVDDIPRWEGEHGWVTAFEESLMRQLPRFLRRGGPLKIWRDKKLGGADFYDDVIGEAVRSSAVMISVMSKAYYDSTYCLDELRAFCDTGVTVDFESGRKSRVFKVLLNDIPEERQDERIARADGYKFFSMEASSGVEKVFRRTPEGAPDQNYWNTVEKMAQELAEVLSRMANHEPPRPAPPTGVTVYLAEVADDLADERAQVRDALTQKGIQVLPELRLPAQADAMREAIEENLKRSVLSVHLMGTLPGKAADGDASPATHVQYRLASETGKQNKSPRIVWLMPGLEIEKVGSATQRTLLESLRYEPESESPLEVLQKDIEELKDSILKKALPPPKKTETRFNIQRRGLVYIAHRPEDEEDAKRIKDLLRGVQQDVMLTRGSNEKEQKRDLRVRMKSCNAVLILYGQPPERWARDIAEEARDLASRRARNPLFAKSVCDGPPSEKPDLGLEFEDWPVLSCRGGIVVDGLEPFIKAVVTER
jgi:hypothetical protein